MKKNEFWTLKIGTEFLGSRSFPLLIPEKDKAVPFYHYELALRHAERLNSYYNKSKLIKINHIVEEEVLTLPRV